MLIIVMISTEMGGCMISITSAVDRMMLRWARKAACRHAAKAGYGESWLP
jgi:hypothetical protein